MIDFALAGIAKRAELCTESSAHLAPVADVVQHIVHRPANRLWVVKVSKVFRNHVLFTHVDLLNAGVQNRLNLVGEQPDAQVLILVLDKDAWPASNQVHNVA